MKIEQIYTGCLAQGAYYIESNGEVAIIDPLREVEPYINRASKDGAKIKFVFETHFHADFVSGHLDLSKKTGAPIVFGPKANAGFEAIIAEDGEIFKVGNISIKVIHTPGHTLESTCYLLLDENGKQSALFSGDTLFLGDVGRPDLAQKSDLTQDMLAGMLYDSLMTKIMPLNDDVTVYPAHGAGSACGKNMSKETVDTLGNQKKTNYALNQANKQDFISAVTDGLLPPPAYFPMNVLMNKNGYSGIDEVIKKGLSNILVSDLEAIIESTGAIVLDCRPAAQFCKGFIPRSINIGIKGDFAPWVGTIIGDVKQSIILVCNKDEEEESITRLARVGFDNVIGIVEGGFEAWKNANKEIDTVDRIGAKKFLEEVSTNKQKIIDVRKESEFENGHFNNASNQPLAFINSWINQIDTKEHFYLHCQGGYRSMIAASVLQARGIRNFSEIDGGYKAISELETVEN